MLQVGNYATWKGISDVCRSSQIPVQRCIRFDRQILPAHCNPTDFQIGQVITSVWSDRGLNIIKPTWLTWRSIWQCNVIMNESQVPKLVMARAAMRTPWTHEPWEPYEPRDRAPSSEDKIFTQHVDFFSLQPLNSMRFLSRCSPYLRLRDIVPLNPHCLLHLTLQRTSLESPISLCLSFLFFHFMPMNFLCFLCPPHVFVKSIFRLFAVFCYICFQAFCRHGIVDTELP